MRSTWNAAITPAIANDKKAYQFALSLAAVERACGGVQETARQIARSRFKVALASFEGKSGEDGKKAGFEVYADTIRLAEEKLSHAGVVMTDGEKKEKFYAGFNPRNSEWQTCKTFWHREKVFNKPPPSHNKPRDGPITNQGRFVFSRLKTNPRWSDNKPPVV